MMIFYAPFHGKKRDRQRAPGLTGWRLAGCVSAIAATILLACPFGCCECLYRWQNGQGDIYYSNVTPPAGDQPFDVVMTDGGRTPMSRKIPAEPSEGGLKGKNGAAVAPLAGQSSVQLRFLVRRIKKRKEEISAIESLLTRRPADAVLRSGLGRKKRYLDEDLRRLGALLKSPGKPGAQGGGGRHRVRQQ